MRSGIGCVTAHASESLNSEGCLASPNRLANSTHPMQGTFSKAQARAHGLIIRNTNCRKMFRHGDNLGIRGSSARLTFPETRILSTAKPYACAVLLIYLGDQFLKRPLYLNLDACPLAFHETHEPIASAQNFPAHAFRDLQAAVLGPPPQGFERILLKMPP